MQLPNRVAAGKDLAWDPVWDLVAVKDREWDPAVVWDRC